MIKHEIKENKLIVTATLEMRPLVSAPEVRIERSDIENYLTSNDIDAGCFIYGIGFVSNTEPTCLTGEWVYHLGPNLKKSLTTVKKSSTIKRQNNKKPSARQRAKNIVEAKKETTSNEKPKPKPRRSRRSSPPAK